MWKNNCGRFSTKKELKKFIAKQHGVIDGIYFCGLEWRIVNGININEKDYWTATWRTKI